MRLTKLGHACVQVAKDDRSVVIDPGTCSEASGALASAGAGAVLITHDHFDAEALRAAMAERPSPEVWTPRVGLSVKNNHLTGAGKGLREFTRIAPGATVDLASP